MWSQCTSLSRHLPGNTHKGPLHGLPGHWEVLTEFNTRFSGGDKGTKLAQAFLNPWAPLVRTPAQGGALEESCWTKSHCCTVPQFPSVLWCKPQESTLIACLEIYKGCCITILLKIYDHNMVSNF